MKRKKIPRKAVERLMKHCEWLSKGSERTAAQIFKAYLELMHKYADYFFSDPWPKTYDFEAATTFTDDDIAFLTAGQKEEAEARFDTMVLKKNINLEHGFMRLIGPFWTWQAFHERFVRPGYKRVKATFDDLSAGDEDARSVLEKLKEKFDVRLIHDSLIDLAEHRYLDEIIDRLLAGLLALLHEAEGLPPCHAYRCELQRKSLRRSGESNNSF